MENVKVFLKAIKITVTIEQIKGSGNDSSFHYN